MKVLVAVAGCFPALRGLSAQQFAGAIEPRLIDVRNPRTGLQVDLFGRVTDVRTPPAQAPEDAVVAEIDIADDFLQRHGLSAAQVREMVAGRITKLRHPATGAMTPVNAVPVQS